MFKLSGQPPASPQAPAEGRQHLVSRCLARGAKPPETDREIGGLSRSRHPLVNPKDHRNLWKTAPGTEAGTIFLDLVISNIIALFK